MREKRLKSLSVLGIFIVFYLVFFVMDGAVICADSASYINMDASREPIYPLFLAALRAICGTEVYLTVAAFLQSILNAVTSWKLTEVLDRHFSLKKWQLGLIIVIQFAPVLLNRFVAKRASTYSCSIMTESITIALWLLLFAFLLEIIYRREQKYIWFAAITCFVMISTRKQMLVVLPLLLLVLWFTYWIPKHSIRHAIFPVAVICLTYLCIILFERGYNYSLRGEFMGHTDSSNTIFSIMLYTSTVDEKEYITEKEYQDLFSEILTETYANGWNYDFAEGGLLALEDHYSESYDSIAINTSQPMIVDFLREQGITDEAEISMQADAVRSAILREVLIHNIPKMFKIYMASFVHGMILTIAVQNSILNLYSLIAYLLYLCLMGYLFKQNRIDKSAKFALLVMIAILGNVVLTSLVIFCQTRYMIYNMPLFYLAFFLMLISFIKQKKLMEKLK
ncbi:MAG: hypothetical protein PHP50_08090 [Lachnospiraceae bacterium]|nr:hypothetical protein [Lachnospiraceae bacterium]